MLDSALKDSVTEHPSALAPLFPTRPFLDVSLSYVGGGSSDAHTWCWDLM